MKENDKKKEILEKDFEKDAGVINLKNLLDDYKKKFENMKKKK